MLAKTERRQSDISKYGDGYEEVKRGTSLRRAAEMHEGNLMSLLRYFRKRYEAGASYDKGRISMGAGQNSPVFKENGITLMSFPPHGSHKLQPLDRSVFGPFKKAINTACDGWMQSHPGKKMSIHDIPGIIKTAMSQAFTQANIQAGFSKTDSLLGASSTPIINQIQPITSTSATPPVFFLEIVQVQQTASTSASPPAFTPEIVQVQQTTSTLATPPDFSPEIVRPFPKAVRRKTRGTRTEKSTIYTETPEKEAVRKEHEKKKRSKAG
ncbi:hypothetical protein JTB14_033738 [Gonioctena quinquepunctata]|nr:hypothetical protein JTB14_033738 [Gonioctena quinquepunctata]